MLTLITSNDTTKNQATATSTNEESKNAKGEELLLSYLLWETKFEDDSHEVFEDPIDVFLTAQGEKQFKVA